MKKNIWAYLSVIAGAFLMAGAICSIVEEHYWVAIPLIVCGFAHMFAGFDDLPRGNAR